MKQIEIRILVTSDIHGYVYPTTFRDQEEKNMGLAKLASIVKRKREEGHVLLIDNGDLIQGSPLTFYHHKFRNTTKNPMITAANYLKYDAVILGNHEFNFGLPVLKEAMVQSEFPWLSANIIENNGNPLAKPYMIKNIAGVRIAIVGLTTHYVPHWEEPAHIAGLHFENALHTAKKWVSHIRSQENPDLLMICYHGGFERDLNTGELVEKDTGENQGYAMCREIDDIDILVTGHQHREIAAEVLGKMVIQPGTKGTCIGEMVIKVVKNENDQIISCSSESSLIHVDDQTPTDEAVSRLLRPIYDETEQWLNQTIGVIEGDMYIGDPFQARLQEHPYVEFINRVQLRVSGAEISCTALFHNRPGGFLHHVTMRQIVANYIYPNTLKTILLSGREIKEALEQSATYFEMKDGEIIVNPKFQYPKQQPYHYDMWEGIEYELKISNPVGNRVTKLNFNGKPIDPEREFTVVMNSYRAAGAGDFLMFKNKPVLKEIQTDMTELIAQELMEKKGIHAQCNHNWRVIV
nr:bifunctional UDP-sugar hydrolase/5'-nucleotidase [uncultured Bacillus sp.]